MLQHAKFRQNRLNRGRDMAIFFPFFKMAAAAILDFENYENSSIKCEVKLHYYILLRCYHYLHHTQS